jgi:N utilization substance protein B
MRKRTQAREIALKALYQHDLHRKMAGDAKAGAADFEAFIQAESGDPEVRGYARTLLDGTLASIDALDERIAAAALNWKLSRIAPVDRSILRLALFELFDSPDVPPKVAINEAIDLAKKFSTEQSGAFVNGILDRIYNDLKRAKSVDPC